MKKSINNKKILYVIFLLLLIIIYIRHDNNALIGILLVEAFCSIHSSLFFLSPLSKVLADSNDDKKVFWNLFLTRVIILLVFNFISPIFIIIFDLVLTFTGPICLVPLIAKIKNKNSKIEALSVPSSTEAVSQNNQILSSSIFTKKISASEKVLKCSKCLKEYTHGNKYCSICGMPLSDNITLNSNELKYDANSGQPFNKSEYPAYLFLGSYDCLDKFIKEKLSNPDYKNVSLVMVENKRNFVTFIYAIIMTILLVIYFSYHVLWAIYFYLFITFFYVVLYSSFNIKWYLTREIKSRPLEKMDYVISSTLSGKLENNNKYKILRSLVLIFTFLLQLVLFYEPHLIYEKTDGGYAVRYYTLGIIKREKSLEIPASYKNEPVVSIRGNVFARANQLETIVLPNTINEIRGGAFLGCKNLRNINLPDGITEIKGNTFERCGSLEKIDIPEGVTRIGGSAFRECYNLEEVNIPKTVLEIGSSAFRDTRISKVCISKDAFVNERAFKNTSTNILYYENNCREIYNYDYYDNYNYSNIDNGSGSNYGY